MSLYFNDNVDHKAMMYPKQSLTHQRGVGALFIAIILLVASTLIVLYAARVGVQDIRASGNNARAKQSFAHAEAGMALMAAKILQGGSTSTEFTTTNFIVTATETEQINITAFGYADGYTIIGPNTIIPINGVAEVTQQYGFQSDFLADGIAAPLIVGGSVVPKGSYQVVGNPNAAGEGVIVSIWVEGTAPISGNPDTCHYAEYYANGDPDYNHSSGLPLCDPNSNKACKCFDSGGVDGTISDADTKGRDIVEDNNMGNFPDDLFLYLLGVPRGHWEAIRDAALSSGGVITGAQCANFNSESNGLYWVEQGGSNVCDMPSVEIGGSAMCDDMTTDDIEFCTVIVVPRPDDRRVGKECRSRWSPDP